MLLKKEHSLFQNPLNLYHSTSSSLQTSTRICNPSTGNFTGLLFLCMSYRSLKALHRRDGALQGQPEENLPKILTINLRHETVCIKT